tara:strand:+ start:1416 stop:1787 length:372 start_codon:yes stop_codon:yes gene_type:complete
MANQRIGNDIKNTAKKQKMLQENKDLELDRTRLQSAEQDHVFTSPLFEHGENPEYVSNENRFDHGLHRFLPVGIRGPVQSIKSANQYIAVTTEMSSYEIRMPLRDAVARQSPYGSGDKSCFKN